MVSVKKKNMNGNTYYYLEHSFRKNDKINKKEKYLGTTLPKNIEKVKEEFLREFYQETWFNRLTLSKNSSYKKEGTSHHH
jgi:CRISPR/Cas system CMR-associated protein Cmr3 (group 5 of RAMP superfamily)